MNALFHTPVMPHEVLSFLGVKHEGRYIDATVGAGGHAALICQAGGKVLGIDWDSKGLAIARQHLVRACPDAVLVQANFASISNIARSHEFIPVNGVLFDVGLSSMQLVAGRGFSFQEDVPLDMRMNPETQGVTAADLLNALSEDQLACLFATTTENYRAHLLARAIIRSRGEKKIERTNELVDIVDRVWRGKRGRIPARHPATTIFLALRMAVNEELENLQNGLLGALEILANRGRVLVISFHSGEDRLVKQFFREHGSMGELRIITKKPVVPTEEEIKKNPRARSAKLRVAEKI